MHPPCRMSSMSSMSSCRMSHVACRDVGCRMSHVACRMSGCRMSGCRDAPPHFLLTHPGCRHHVHCARRIAARRIMATTYCCTGCHDTGSHRCWRIPFRQLRRTRLRHTSILYGARARTGIVKGARSRTGWLAGRSGGGRTRKRRSRKRIRRSSSRRSSSSSSKSKNRSKSTTRC